MKEAIEEKPLNETVLRQGVKRPTNSEQSKLKIRAKEMRSDMRHKGKNK